MLSIFSKFGLLPRSAARKQFFSTRCTKVFEFLSTPVRTTPDESKLPKPIKINQETVELLEKLSLVRFENDKGIEIVENAIRFADQIFEVDTTNIKPLFTLLEDESLHLREDSVKNDVSRYELMTYSKLSEENYYVAPAGNIKYSTKKSRENSVTPISSPPSLLEEICKN